MLGNGANSRDGGKVLTGACGDGTAGTRLLDWTDFRIVLPFFAFLRISNLGSAVLR
jgi:hypothetical protein